MRCNRAGRMDTAREFIALLTCGVWDKLLAERQSRKLSGLELICELADEDRDCCSLLLVMRSGHLHRVDAAGRKIAAENKRDAG
jgi:hypothetical protein